MTSLVWFRNDLRLADNPALTAAASRGAVIPVFIWAPEEESPWQPGGASRWWQHQSLASLDQELRKLGSRLITCEGPSLLSLKSLLTETKATAVFWNRRYEPAIIARDKIIKERLLARGTEAHSFNGALLHEPWTIQNQSGKPFQVFTPFWKHCLAKEPPTPPLPTPKNLPAPTKWPKSLPLDALGLEPKINWAGGLRKSWRPGEPGAQANLKKFLGENLANYSETRNRPDLSGTSRLSPHLHFGEITPRQIWHKSNQPHSSPYLAELGWREFSHHLLCHFPKTPTEPLRPAFQEFPWRDNPGFLKAWQKGLTGYPLVDAGMRELWATGFMHNRVRMVVASFLVKDLLLDWRCGARWFWDTLVDADLAQNTLNWQWSAGCGADAAPYFRIFNPVNQGEKFDPKDHYVRQWCPELANLPDRWIHEPSRAPVEILEKANVILDKTYPRPVVQHRIAREMALEAFAKMKSRAIGSGPSRES